MRQAKAIITVATGRHGTRQFPVQRVESYATSQSVDNDADQFSVDIGDSANQLALCLDRDNEVRVNLFLNNEKGQLAQIFSGTADAPNRDEDMVLSIAGRDTPSSVAVDSDALPGRWKHVSPTSWIAARAHALGITDVRIPKLSFIKSLYTDGSEKEWALWYRVARMKGMYMWTTQTGALVIDKLGYSTDATYRLGQAPRGQSASRWLPIEAVNMISNKQTRLRKVVGYGEEGAKKTGRALVATGIDTSIASWKKRPVLVMNSTTAKNQSELKDEVDEAIFESIVGSQEMQITVQDTGVLIQQNRMALVNLPSEGIVNELWYIVGVQRNGGPDGAVQIVRLREKGFALPKKVPNAPTLTSEAGDAEGKAVASISAALAGLPNIKWPDSFVKATAEFGVPAGWNFALFLGVLLSICAQESGFRNVREGKDDPWQPWNTWYGEHTGMGEPAARSLWESTFANADKNPRNPYNREAGVGPMQLTSLGYKQWADEYGWNGTAKKGELDGGRWNADSNIRASARALVEKLKAVNADPTNGETIWAGVAAYNGSQAYADAVRARYKALFGGEAAGAVASAKSLPEGSTNTSLDIPGHGVLKFPANTPDEILKAINFCMRRLGDKYEWGGAGPLYDCSSFVTAALASGAPYLKQMLDEPRLIPTTSGNSKHHGESTYTLIKKGTAVPKDNLLPGDLILFRHEGGTSPEHVAMYLTDGLMIHDANSIQGVIVSGLNNDYYRDLYITARRLARWFIPGVTDFPG